VARYLVKHRGESRAVEMTTNGRIYINTSNDIMIVAKLKKSNCK